MPADAGIHPLRVHLLAVMPADAGIHRACLRELAMQVAPVFAGVTTVGTPRWFSGH